MTQIISNVYETREWPEDFTEDTMIAFLNNLGMYFKKTVFSMHKVKSKKFFP
jgi:hypothetical protein